MSEPSAIAARSAIEALRAGVPNRSAIRLLGSEEDTLRQDFLGRLGLCDAALQDDCQVEGILLAGAFGAGKSHQLGFLADLAQRERFVVSQIPISKETPLFDPGRLFAAAIRGAVVPCANDDVMTAVMAGLRPDSDPYDNLESWTSAEVQKGRLSALFAALLHLIPRRTIDPDDLNKIARFFGGGKLNVTVAKGWLRGEGAAKLFNLKSTREADLALQRLRFAPRLFRAAGYSGWCILLDELELIGRYSPLQRGRSYAELLRWLGMDKAEQIPGIATVAAISDDFPAEMFERRRDDELIPARLEQRGWVRQAALARKGIALLERPEPKLRAPDEAALRRKLKKVSGLYRDAYGSTPSDIEVGERLGSKSIRQYVKSWITIWDIERLYHASPSIEVDTIPIDYTESSQIEQPSALGGEDDAEG